LKKLHEKLDAGSFFLYVVRMIKTNEKHTIIKNGKFFQQTESLDMACKIVRMFETRIDRFKGHSPFVIVKSKDAFGLFGPEGIAENN